MFDCLDFVYLPSRDVAADVTHFTRRLGGKLVFAIEAFGTRVAMVRLDPHPPPLLLAEHLQGDQPVLVYRVADLDRAIAELRDREVEVAVRFEIPHGPGAELAASESGAPEGGALPAHTAGGRCAPRRSARFLSSPVSRTSQSRWPPSGAALDRSLLRRITQRAAALIRSHRTIDASPFAELEHVAIGGASGELANAAGR